MDTDKDIDRVLHSVTETGALKLSWGVRLKTLRELELAVLGPVIKATRWDVLLVESKFLAEELERIGR